MHVKGAFLHAMELGKAVFCVAPKALDSVNVVWSECELVVAMIDS